MTTHPDRGAVDVSLQMLFGAMTLLFTLLLLFETTAYWHARNVFDDAAAEGARVAAAYDGTCRDGVGAARAMVVRHAGAWAEPPRPAACRQLHGAAASFIRCRLDQGNGTGQNGVSTLSPCRSNQPPLSPRSTWKSCAGMYP